MSWKKAINEISRRKYTIPDGWDTKETIAAELECPPGRVAQILKPGIESGEIERKEFHVWNPKRNAAVRVACFRVREGGAAGKSRTPATPPPDLESRLLRAIRDNPGRADRDIAKSYRGATAAMVAALRPRGRKVRNG